MSHPYIHAVNSVRRYGGIEEDYLPLHNWFDESKSWIPDWRHRAMRHHREGISEAVELFGTMIMNSDGREVSVSSLGEDHCTEDVGFVPVAQDWAEFMNYSSWEEFEKAKFDEHITRQNFMKDELPKTLALELSEV